MSMRSVAALLLLYKRVATTRLSEASELPPTVGSWLVRRGTTLADTNLPLAGKADKM